MIDISGLSYRYPGDREDAGRPALAGIDLELAAGELLLVAGESGCGKSTLLRCLDGLVPHFHGGVLSGRLRIAGRDPVASGPRTMSRAVGMVFQDPETQFVTQRVDDELAFALESRGVPPAAIGVRLGEVAEALGLAALLRRRVDTLSGGERQKVAIGSALALRPELLVLDEPTSQLDPETAADLLALLGRLHRGEGLTVVLSEHRLERVARHADRACLLTAGRRGAVVGTPAEVLAASPLAPPVTRLGHALGWRPPPLTVAEARRHLAELRLPPPEAEAPLSAAPAAGRGVPPVLAGRGLAYRYPGGPAALAGVDLAVAPGEVVALVGRNGSGKSTLLRLLVGLLRPDAGSVQVSGRDVAGEPLHRIARRVGLVPQNPSRLLFADTLADEVAFTRRAHGLPPADPEPLLGRLGLSGLAGVYPRDLSGGERQRAALGAILAAEPEVLLLDEPTRGLDAPAKRRLAELLVALAADGRAVVVATHDVELAARCAGRTVRLAGGRVAADGPTAEVLAGTPFSPQIPRLTDDRRWLTAEALLAALGVAGETGGGVRHAPG